MKKLTLPFLILFVLINIQNIYSQEIRDIIKPIKLVASVPDTILISDIFYVENYNLKFEKNKNISVHWIPKKNLLVLKAGKSFEGMTLVSFNFYSKKYFIPVKSEIIQSVLFKYKPEGNPKRVNLFGSFNGWNREILPMINENGSYEISVPLDPGRYEYKFFVDGNEVIDKNNPKKTPNGFGSFNSVITVKNRHLEKCYLHILGMKKLDDKIIFSYFYEKENQTGKITNQNIISLIDNGIYPAENISINGDTINLVYENSLDQNGVIRTAVNLDGQTTNIQTIKLYKGMPEGEKNNFNWHDAIIYSIMIDRFKDGDTSNTKPVYHPKLTAKANYNGGDFQGILDEIESGYFNSLGVNTLWLSPVVDNTDSAYQEYPVPHSYYTGYHGYWPISFKKVEEEFGTFDLLKKLIAEAHKHNLKILFDYVANHIHIENPLWKIHRDWFGHLRLPDGRLNLRMWDEHRLTTWFEPFMPKFDYRHSKAALDSMANNAIWWIKETNADGFRHDAVKHIPNIFWRTLTKKLKNEIEIPENKIVFQIGETFGSYKLVNSYVNNGQLNAQFNFNLYDTAIPTFIQDDLSFKALDEQMQKTFSVYGINHLMGNIMDSHDKVRFLAYADNDVPLGSRKADSIGWFNPPHVDHPSSYKKEKLYLSYLLTIPGIPVIDYGDEFGMTGASDPDNRRMMRFGNNLSRMEKEQLKNVTKLIKIRDIHPALRYGDFETLKADKDFYIFIRSDMNERILVVLNKNKSEQNLEITLPPVYNLKNADELISGKKYQIENNVLQTNVPGIDYLIFELN